MKIILIGYRASGKSTIGRVLSARLGYEFVDIDLEIMAKYDNKSVAEIWNEFGEPAYRETECDVTEEACQQDNVVIALGGGTAMEERAFNALHAAQGALRFFLEAPAAVLHERSNIDTANTDNRPSLTSIGGGLEEIQHVLSIREPVYRRLADHTIDVAEQSLDAAANQIFELVSSA